MIKITVTSPNGKEEVREFESVKDAKIFLDSLLVCQLDCLCPVHNVWHADMSRYEGPQY